MDGIFNLRLRAWMVDAINRVTESGVAQDMHIDELFEMDFKTLSQQQLFENCCSIGNMVDKYAREMQLDLPEVSIYISIDLISESNVFIGLPASENEIIKAIDVDSIPEIIIYKETRSNQIPLVEFYRTPVLYEKFEDSPQRTMFYKEYRSLEDILNNNEYTREINIILQPVVGVFTAPPNKHPTLT